MKSLLFKFIFLPALTFALGSSIDYGQSKSAQDIDTNRIKANLEWLASDRLEGRRSASTMEKKAAEYIADELKKTGLKAFIGDSSYIQSFSLEEFTIDSDSHLAFAINGKQPEEILKLYDEYFFMKGYIKGIIDTLVDAVYSGYGITEQSSDDYEKLNVKGKVAVLRAGMPEDTRLRAALIAQGIYPDMDYKIKNAEKHGAVGVIIVSDSLNTANWDRMKIRAKRPQQRFPSEKEKTGNFFVAVVRPEVFKAKLEPYTSHLVVKVKTSVNTAIVNSYNAAAVLTGSDPVLKNEYVLIGAHHDHLGIIDGKIYNGADDNASGVASVIETARILKRLGQNKRSVIFISHGSEENGLLGSEFFASHFKKIKDVSAMINIDMVGRENRDTIYPIGSGKLSKELKNILEETNRNTANFIFNYKFDDPLDPERMYYRSDHYNYAKKGVPVVFFYDYMLKDYHKDTDDTDKIDYRKITKCIQLVYNMVLNISNLDHKITVDIKH